MDSSKPVIRWHTIAAPASLLLCVFFWYWPIFFGDRPVGGDVSAFFYPLMQSYDESLEKGSLVSLWNDRWGYGFPSLAESQTASLYPIHVLLYSMLNTSEAFVLNLLIHMIMAALSAYFAARVMGLRPLGAWLCGFVFFAGDFFTVHAPHQWAYMSGSWFPVVLMITWKILQLGASGDGDLDGQEKQGTFSKPGSLKSKQLFHGHSQTALLTLLLSGSLACQMLTGHFQLAFITQVMMFVITGFSVFQRTTSRGLRCVRTGYILLGWIAGYLLAAAQLIPTAELLQESSHDVSRYEYLSGFSNTPWHLINYGAGLLFQNPLWRGLVWSPVNPATSDPWHTAPEECLNYVGLIPLCFALGAAWKWRRTPQIRLWALLAVFSLILSLGPYFPGFRLLIQLPGFGWFRANARWTLATTFWISVLSGFALDHLTGDQLRRWTRIFSIAWISVMLVAGLVFWTVLTTDLEKSSWKERWTDGVWQVLSPWQKDSWKSILLHWKSPPSRDEWTMSQLATLGYDLTKDLPDTVSDQFGWVIVRELTPAIGVMVLMLGLSLFLRLTPMRWKTLAIVITVLDLALFSLRKPLDWDVPMVPYQSSVFQTIKKISETTPGTSAQLIRTVDEFSNLPMAAGLVPVLAYRTLDIPVFPERLTQLSLVGSVPVPTEVRDLLALSGIQYSILRERGYPISTGTRVKDPKLARWMRGSAYVDQLERVQSELLHYRIMQWPKSPGQAWTIPLSKELKLVKALDELPDRDSVVSATLTRESPERIICETRVECASLLIVSDLYYPGWEVVVDNGVKQSNQEMYRAFKAWRAVLLPAAGEYRVTMDYRPVSFQWGKWISLVAASIWILAMLSILGGCCYKWSETK